MSGLHVYSNGDDYVIASSEADAMAVWLEHIGEKAEDYPEMSWQQKPDVYALSIRTEDGEDELRCCAEWAEKEGRGFLCSHDY